MKRTRLSRTRSFTRPSRLRPVSPRREREAATRRALPDPPCCEIEIILRTASLDHWPTDEARRWALLCGGPLHWHERRKRSAGGSIVNPVNLVGACNRHNDWVEDNPLLAREIGGTLLVCREGDLGYDELTKRWDP